MISKARQFLIKLSQSSEEVQFYFGNEISGDFTLEIEKKYNLKANYLDDLMYDIFINDFNFDFLENKIVGDLGVTVDIAKKMTIDILGIIFFPLDKYLKADIKKEIEKRGGDVAQYQSYVLMLKEAVEDEAFNILEELIKKHEELVNPEKEAAASFDIFTNNLKIVLSDAKGPAVVGLNSCLIYLLYNKKSFKEEITKVLLNNQEKLTKKEFILDEKPQRPTIANWLKDFIKTNGSDMFNDLVLAKYLVNTKNIKELNDQEKSLLKKLILLYRNLKFFPESMGDAPAEKWEIIPLDHVEDKKIKIGATDLKQTVPGKPEKKEEKQDEWQELLNQYPVGSLERKAIEEEMRKYKDGIKK